MANPRDEVAFRRVVNKPVRGVGPASQDKIVEAGLGQNLVESAKKNEASKKSLGRYCGILQDF